MNDPTTDEFFRMPLEAFPEHLVETATQAIARYSVGLLREHRTAGSGTLVSVGDRHGVLTAHHVADIFTAVPGVAIGINYRSTPHDFHVKNGDWELITLGTPPDPVFHPKNSKYTFQGPDLAFLWIKNERDLAALGSEKSFYPLEINQFSQYQQAPLDPMRLIVSGAPGGSGILVVAN